MVTALVGAPFFLWLIIETQRGARAMNAAAGETLGAAAASAFASAGAVY